VVIAEAALARENIGRHTAEQHVGVGDLRALVGQVARLDEDGGRAGRLQDPPTLLGAERGNAQGGRVEDLHPRRSVAAIGPWGAGGTVDAR